MDSARRAAADSLEYDSGGVCEDGPLWQLAAEWQILSALNLRRRHLPELFPLRRPGPMP